MGPDGWSLLDWADDYVEWSELISLHRWFESGWETMFEPMRAWMREAAHQGTAGYVENWIAESLPWGFSPAAVRRQVHL